MARAHTASLCIAITAVALTAIYCRPKLKPQHNKLILNWVPFFGTPIYFGSGGSEAFEAAACEYSACEIISDRRAVPLDQYDALLFHGYEDYEILFGTPSVRSPNQLYVFVCVESSRRTPIAERRRDFFNLTYTYRLDSDVFWPYFAILDATGREVAPAINPTWLTPTPPEKQSKLYKEIKDLVAGKRRMAAWYVSNCNSESGREKFVKDLQSLGIEVDIYGACGTMTCPVGEARCTTLVSEYYFYIGFENSLCEDYVTEKAITGLVGGAVPVILSGANLTRFLPPESYLDARTLGPAGLAAEMVRIASKPELYERMFWWRAKYSVVRRGPGYPWRKGEHPLCKLCADLHKEDRTVIRKNEVKEWWHTSEAGFGETCS